MSRVVVGILLVSLCATTAPLRAQRGALQVVQVEPNAIPGEASSLVLSRNDYGADTFLLLRWHVALLNDCEEVDAAVDPYGLAASPASCVGRQFLTVQAQDPPGSVRAFELINVPALHLVQVAMHSRTHARLRLHLRPSIARPDTSFSIARGAAVVLELSPESVRVVESAPRLPAPAVIHSDTTLIQPAWRPGTYTPGRLRVVFRAGVAPEARDSLLRQPGIAVTNDRGRFVDILVAGDRDACRLRDVINFFETKAEVYSAVLQGRGCGANSAPTPACPPRRGAACG